MVISGIRIADIALDTREADDFLGLMRNFAGYYATVQHSGWEWRTRSKPICDGVVEWSGLIPIPSDMSASISLEVYGSFEFQPTLGDGEWLRKSTITLGQLLYHSEKDLPHTLYLPDGKVESSSSSLSVTVTPQKRQNDHISVSRVIRPHRSVTEPQSELEKATNQGHSTLSRYRRNGKKRDLERSIEQFERALDICPLNDPRRAVALSNVAMVKHILCRVDNIQHSLDVPLTLYLDALAARPTGHPDRHWTLIQIAVVHLERFEKLQHPVDAAEARKSLSEILTLSPAKSYEARVALQLYKDLNVDRVQIGHHSSVGQSSVWNWEEQEAYDLSVKLLCRFQESSDLADLQRAIATLETLVQSIATWRHWYLGRLTNLGTALQCRFTHLGDLRDLERAIALLKDAVGLTPEGDLDKPGRLGSLANCFYARFEHSGELKDLESAISLFRGAIDLFPQGDTAKLDCLNSLSVCFSTRFHRLGELDDLERAISILKDTLDLTPEGHPFRLGYLSNLGARLKDRYEHFGELSDLEYAASIYRDAVNLTPDDHSEKHSYLHHLANSLKTRFKRFGELNDLEEAILLLRDAINLTPAGHPSKSRRLSILAILLRFRFKKLGNLSDLEESISRSTDAVELTPENHPDQPNRLLNLSACFLTRFRRLGEQKDLERAISFSSHAACATVGSIAVRFAASKAWIICARLLLHHSLLDAYSVSIGLLPQFAWIGLSMTHRYQELMTGAGIVREAAAAAIESGQLETAVEWLEQGRSIVWGELFQLRTSYDELSLDHPDYAHRLRELSVELESAGAAREQSLSELLPTRSNEPLEKVADRHRMLAIERDELLRDIRAIPGFERFLLHKGFSEIRAMASSGPVVILNAAKSRCDALIILPGLDQVIPVSLPNFTLARSMGLQKAVKNLLGSAHPIRCDQRIGEPVVRGRGSWGPILAILWHSVVQPVLVALGLSTPGDTSRIFWCPTGPFTFLPVHAAGLYGMQHSEPGHKIFDFVVSSYIPTLSILASSSTSTAALNNDIRLLTVCQPPSDGQPALPGVTAELEHIESVIQNAPSARTTLTTSSSGTVEEVLALMKDTTWVHFACHGIQDDTNPTQSGLCLADGRRLKLSDMIALSRPCGGLAFLSACQTAMGDEKLSEEAVHIAAGMLFAGFGGVVGTMWSINDRLAPGVARDVYEQLLNGDSDGVRDHREAARALHRAIARLRESGEARFEEWIPFIHVGH